MRIQDFSVGGHDMETIYLSHIPGIRRGGMEALQPLHTPDIRRGGGWRPSNPSTPLASGGGRGDGHDLGGTASVIYPCSRPMILL